MWREVKHEFLIEALKTGVYYKEFGNSDSEVLLFTQHPWPSIFKQTLLLLPIGGLIWFGTLISRRDFLQKQTSLLKAIAALGFSLSVAVLLTYESIRISDSWYWAFYPCWFATGIHQSRTVYYGSWYFVLPATAMLVFCILQTKEVNLS